MKAGDCDLGLVGLGVMGRNLALNMADKGYRVAGYDTDKEKVAAFRGEGGEGRLYGVHEPWELVASMSPPRAVMMMVPAGAAVDAVIEDLLPLLHPGDILIDGGNSHFRQTDVRAQRLETSGILYMGVGISGGERGARFGPSIMAGGPDAAYARIRPIFESIAAKVDGDSCVAHVGPGSAGSYVKMVHNGIEYGMMQVIAESYDMMKRGLGLGNNELALVYDQWNGSELKGYLMEITAQIFRRRDEGSESFLVDAILDEAQGKGTGKWTAQDAMDLRTPAPTMGEAVTARDLSDLRDERQEAAGILSGPVGTLQEEKEPFMAHLREGVVASVLIVYAQGMAQLRDASRTYGYGLDLKEVARIWRGGCIIRSAMLDPICRAFSQKADLMNLLLDPLMAEKAVNSQAGLRYVVGAAARSGLPTPALASCLAYFDGFRSAWLPANLVQAQRDYFGSHMYRRTDREGLFHTQWEE